MAKFYIGTSGWHYEDWRDKFYPGTMPKVKWLEYYSGKFQSVELNNTFYRRPSEAAVENWCKSCPPGFIFSVKANRFITHIKRLKNCEEALKNFILKVSILKEKLGPLLYQLPPSIKRNDDLLVSFLSGLPAGYKHVIEFRHESWLTEDVFNIMRKHNTGLCVFDLPAFTCPLLYTSDYMYIRFHGSDSLYSGKYSEKVLSDWAAGIAAIAEKLNYVYIYFNNDVSGFALDNAATIRDYLI